MNQQRVDSVTTDAGIGIARSGIVAGLVFAAGFSLALQGWMGRATAREISGLEEQLIAACDARDHARDEYEAMVYDLLFPRPLSAEGEFDEAPGLHLDIVALPAVWSEEMDESGGVRRASATLEALHWASDE